jgi:hypothetical protein
VQRLHCFKVTVGGGGGSAASTMMLMGVGR